MTTPAITLEVLPAGFGDCLLITCQMGGRQWCMLIDTGPDETYPVLRRRLARLPLAADGRRHIDLFVVSHIDHDHIGGAAQLLADTALALSFDDIWFNAPAAPVRRGVAEGQRLAGLLGAGDIVLPWNRAWSGKSACTPAAGGGVELTGRGTPTLTLLSPAPEQLQRLYTAWDKELARLQSKSRDAAPPAPVAARGPAPSLEELASRITPEDRAAPNGSSIAFLLEHRGASALLCADAHPGVMVAALAALAARRGQAGPLPLDAVKLSHHGSRANVTTELMRAVKAQHFIVSTNNTYFNHPDPEAIARVVVGNRGATLWFNHDTPYNRRWDTAELKSRHGYDTVYPTRPDEGVTLLLPARR